MVELCSLGKSLKKKPIVTGPLTEGLSLAEFIIMIEMNPSLKL